MALCQRVRSGLGRNRAGAVRFLRRWGGAQEGSEPSEISFLELDAPNVIIEAVKKAEDSDDIVLRLYESEHRGTRVQLHFNIPVRSVTETNLMEQDTLPLDLQEDRIALDFRPFEIKTLRVAIHPT